MKLKYSGQSGMLKLLQGRVKFFVAGEGVRLVNQIRRFSPTDIKIYDDGVEFSVSLLYSKSTERLLFKKEYTKTVNTNIFTIMNFFINHGVLSIGLAVCFVVLICLQNVVFKVKIVGLENDKVTEVTKYLDNKGVKKFAAKTTIKDKDILFDLVNDFPYIAEAAVSVNGATATISIIQMDYPEILSGDILATVGGVIFDIIVFSGIATVENGDVVHAGDVLVTGSRPSAIIKISNGNEIVDIITRLV